MEANQQIGTILKEFRKEFGITQQELAEILQIKTQQVSNYETGKSAGAKEYKIRAYIDKLNDYKHNSIASKNTSILTSGNTRSALSLKDNEHYRAIPFFQLNVSAGNVHFLDNGLLKGTEPDGYMFIPRHIDADIAFPTYGHSMHPDISNGDVVAYKILKDMSFFNYGMKYLVVTDEQRMVKFINPHKKPGYLLLESKNPEFGPIDLPVKSIRHLLQVRYIGKTEM